MSGIIERDTQGFYGEAIDMFCPNCGKEQAGTPTFCFNCGFRLVPEPVVVPGEAMPVIAVPVKYAGFWRRLVAFIVDCFLIIVVFFITLFIIGNIIYYSFRPDTEIDQSTYDGIFTLAVILLILSIYWLYYALMESSSRQATLGKMAVGSIVTDSEGRRISFGRATGRSFASLIPLIIPLIGYIVVSLMIAFSAKKQGLHDMIADTQVVQK